MAQNSRLPKNTNTNNLQTNKFTFYMPTLPILSYFCQSVTIPGVNTNEVTVPTPFSDTYRHGDKIIYDPLVLTFEVDEDMKNWEESYKWLCGLTFPHSTNEYYNQVNQGLYHDGYLTINKNSNVTNIRMKFTNCHPISLGPIQMATADDPNTIPQCDLTLRFDLLEMDRL